MATTLQTPQMSSFKKPLASNVKPSRHGYGRAKVVEGSHFVAYLRPKELGLGGGCVVDVMMKIGSLLMVRASLFWLVLTVYLDT